MNRSSRNRRFPGRFSLSSNSRLLQAQADGNSFLFDFRERALDGRLVFSRTSPGSYTDSDNILKFANANAPRWDWTYGNIAGSTPSATFRGLLIEGQSTNSACFSETFATSGSLSNNWNYNGQTGALLSATGNNPANGTTNFRFAQTAVVTNTAPLQLDVTVTAVRHTFSIWIQGAIFNSVLTGNATIAISQSGSPVAITAAIIVGGGSVTVVGNVANVSGLPNSAAPSQVGWTRVQVTTSAALTAGTASILIYPNSDGAQVINSALFLYGAQFEADRINASSYIQTDIAQATRNADGISLRDYTNGAYGVNATSPAIGSPPAGYTIIGNACFLQAATSNYPRVVEFANATPATQYGIFFGNPDAPPTKLRGLQYYPDGLYYNETSFAYTNPSPTSFPFSTFLFALDAQVFSGTTYSYRDGVQRSTFSETLNPNTNLSAVTAAGINRTNQADHPITWWRWFGYYPYCMSLDEFVSRSFNPEWR